MFKLITIGVLLYLLYRLVFPPALNQGQKQEMLDQQEDDGEFIDYEEID